MKWFRSLAVMLFFISQSFAQAVFYGPSSGSSGSTSTAKGANYFYDQSNQSGLTATSSIGSLAGLMQNLMLFAGICMLFVALNKYFEHRKSPQYAPLSNVFGVLLVAVALFALGLINSDSL